MAESPIVHRAAGRWPGIRLPVRFPIRSGERRRPERAPPPTRPRPIPAPPGRDGTTGAGRFPSVKSWRRPRAKAVSRCGIGSCGTRSGRTGAAPDTDVLERSMGIDVRLRAGRREMALWPRAVALPPCIMKPSAGAVDHPTHRGRIGDEHQRDPAPRRHRVGRVAAPHAVGVADAIGRAGAQRPAGVRCGRGDCGPSRRDGGHRFGPEGQGEYSRRIAVPRGTRDRDSSRRRRPGSPPRHPAGSLHRGPSMAPERVGPVRSGLAGRGVPFIC